MTHFQRAKTALNWVVQQGDCVALDRLPTCMVATAHILCVSRPTSNAANHMQFDKMKMIALDHFWVLTSDKASKHGTT